ncbi:MogA/MoaB family molybdenum cofactor biosynthesis protein [Bacillus sp. 1P06AnD]|uniref:MogA/MoaB family molybdenum cofactor biosynthesis protein n=1 Tax=Bacillus sp. 1P06AnD TaxID=3132208 RepID=UPI0039A202E7
MSVSEHKQEAKRSLNIAIITVSDTRVESTDKSGQKMKQLAEEKGHKVYFYRIVKDDAGQIASAIEECCQADAVDVILLNGGTGISKRDVTVETVNGLLDKHLPGYGEIFRLLSYQEDIGSAAILSRATAGVAKGKAIFTTPGSTGAVTLAMNKLILPELAHAVREITK